MIEESKNSWENWSDATHRTQSIADLEGYCGHTHWPLGLCRCRLWTNQCTSAPKQDDGIKYLNRVVRVGGKYLFVQTLVCGLLCISLLMLWLKNHIKKPWNSFSNWKRQVAMSGQSHWSLQHSFLDLITTQRGSLQPETHVVSVCVDEGDGVLLQQGAPVTVHRTHTCSERGPTLQHPHTRSY